MKTKILLFLLSLSVGLFGQSGLDLCKPVGWATQNGGTTGGGSAAPVTVSTYADFKSKLTDNTTKVVYVSGTITIPASGRVDMKDVSGKTIIGLAGSKLVSTDMTKTGSGILFVSGCKNLIFRNLYFEGPGAYDTDGYDNICFDNCQNVWVDHCEFHDGMDGNLDIKNASNYISVTWCTFSYEKPPKAGGPGGAPDHRYTSLFGSSDGATQDDGKLSITMQYCWWGAGCRERMPRIRFGKVHIANSLFNSTVSNHCIRAGFKANVLAEGNYFDNQKKPIDEYEGNYTSILGRNNFGAAAIAKGTAFIPPYTLAVAAPEDIVTPIKTCAGQKLSTTNGCSSCGGTTPPNASPVVSITAPANNAAFTAPASVAITANATDSDGSIAKVEFYNGTTLLGSDASAPYAYTWAGVAAGTYSITAKATDDKGATTTSAAVSITVATSGTPTLTNTGGLVQIVTSGSAIAPIVFTWGGTATDVTYTTLPAGLSAVKNAASKTLTVSGTPTANGTFTVTTSGGSPAVPLKADISVTTVVPPITNCEMSLDGYASLDGEGIAKTTGGTGGKEVPITTLAELQTWAAAREKNTTAEIAVINGKIESPSSIVLTIKNGSNITILGKSGGELKNIGLNIRDYNNVIVQNLKIHEVAYPNDALTLDNVNHGWVTHCELYSTIGSGIGYDTYDGLLDVKNGSRYITISWNRLHDHMKVMLFGHTDNASSQTIDEKLRVSLHHNYVYNTDGRNPSLRWGAVHSYNNYFNGITDYGMAVRRYAHVKIENNVYKNVKEPIATDNFIVDAGDDGSVCESGSLFINCGPNSITKTDCSWWNSTTLPYSYTLTPAAEVAALVELYAGVCGETHAAVPAVQITAPSTSTASYAVGTPITLSATASVAGGTIAKVEFYTKKEDVYTSIAVVTSAPYTTVWSNAKIGTYNVYANAYDSKGNFAFSNCVVITVTASSVPTLTDPANKVQAVAAGLAIEPIIFTWGGSATSAQAATLPAGLSAKIDAATKTVTISGTPTAAGTFTVSTIGGTPAVVLSGSITIKPADTRTQTISLAAGWNLVSINVIPADRSLEAVLKPILNAVTEVKTLDAYWRAGNAASSQSLSVIESGIGYMLLLTSPATLTVTGTPAPTPATSLKAGLSLIGVPAAAAVTAPATGNGIDWIKGSAGSPAQLEPGKAYFIYTNSAASIVW